MDLTTTYLGLELRSPLVASSGPLTGRLEGLRALEAAASPRSCCPRCSRSRSSTTSCRPPSCSTSASGGNPEAAGYFPDLGAFETLADRYLRHLEEAKRRSRSR
jgi:dihydroorotate dehydrogenase (fumarate)